MFSTMASTNRSVSAILAAGSVLMFILERVSATNCFPACRQIQVLDICYKKLTVAVIKTMCWSLG